MLPLILRGTQKAGEEVLAGGSDSVLLLSNHGQFGIRELRKGGQRRHRGRRQRTRWQPQNQCLPWVLRP
jgi:hypothetical protein